MTKPKTIETTLLLASFIIVVMLNWLYTSWIKSLFEEVVTSWFLIVPLLFYFYFTFAVIAAYFMHQRKRLGLILACFVILMGAIIAVLSYAAVFKLSGIYELLIIPLIVLNCLMLIFLACYQGCFT